MEWENVGITHERLNGLKVKVAQITPPTTVPKLIDHILEENGIGKFTDEEREAKLKELEALIK